MSNGTTPPRGALIVIEGLDRAGKSTQCDLLLKNLQKRGHKIRHRRFPDRTTSTGELINKYLKGEAQQEDHVIHLLFSANRWEAAPQIEADIAAGLTVVVDRYYFSGCAYSAAKNIPGLDLPWARCPEVGLPQPDICIFLDISAEDAAKRGGYGEERYESRHMQDRVRKLFHELQTLDDTEDVRVIDAGQPVDVVEKAVLSLSIEHINQLAEKRPALRKLQPAR